MIAEIKFSHGEPNVFGECEFEVAPKNIVIFDTEKGENYGRVLRIFDSNRAFEFNPEVQILRHATEEDLAKIELVEAESQEAKKQVRESVIMIGLDMKVVDVAYNLEKNQLFISFTADKRVDFRELLKALAASFHARIELRQIGPRDAARIYGGIGPCGRPLCCSEFIYEFPNVSIKMAKNQALSLKQNKLNGLCGRLMCCLTYENDFYKEAQEQFPDFGQDVKTHDGKGRVIGLNILKHQVKVKLENGIKDFDVTELEGVHG
ncbi:regulatory iron-sulfur-containing complex subunit RicT [Lactococcus fujiensis]|uniref:PSP1 C-terminal domain-containing protein n=1 Tax=Lactococcus fujiensis JCM 16395 TaxID=1291764 RepID=A0A2A5RN56_9LACT|nr:regulatory iron-sulfur-containing complex subunit RicT [Lactococcus fujiensis]PCS00769.1 hypothetical protein RT41_GL001151 [Lactococcus fujiensis JCM 16395]